MRTFVRWNSLRIEIQAIQLYSCYSALVLWSFEWWLHNSISFESKLLTRRNFFTDTSLSVKSQVQCKFQVRMLKVMSEIQVQNPWNGNILARYFIILKWRNVNEGTPPSQFKLTESILLNKCNSRIGIEPSDRSLIFSFIWWNIRIEDDESLGESFHKLHIMCYTPNLNTIIRNGHSHLKY